MSEKSDACTTTDDIQMPPLCLFYFSHPFGILSPDPPKVTDASERNFSRPWIHPQSWPFPDCFLPITNDARMWSQSNKKNHLQNTKPRLKIKKTKCQMFNQKRQVTKARGNNLKTCDAFAVADDVISDGSRTLSEDAMFEENLKSTRAFDCKNKLQCKNLICCGGVNTFNGECNRIHLKKKTHKVIREFDSNQNKNKTLPPLERPSKLCSDDVVYKRWLDVDHQRNSFRLKAFLPPIQLEDFERLSIKPSTEQLDDRLNTIRDISFCAKIELNANENEAEVFAKEKSEKIMKVKRRKRRRSVKSSGGINKARGRPHRSAARKLVTCLLQSVSSDRRAPTATLPALSEVLKTVKEAWSSPKSFHQRCNSSLQTSSPSNKESFVMLDSKERCAARAGASPGLLRRRYSVPETVMRKYKLAQHKSDTDDSDFASAPSPPSAFSPARRLGQSNNRGSKGFLNNIKPSPLLRRLWGRQGGSHSELRFWDSCSGSSSCELCKRSDKNVLTNKLELSPLHKMMHRASRSPKKTNPLYSQGFSPERYITHLENTRDMLLRESRAQLTSPGKYKTGSALSERSFFKSSSVSEGSPKLGLSSLATSSYPVTDENSSSDIVQQDEATQSSTSHSSANPSHTRYENSLDRPMTAECSSRKEKFHSTSESNKRRQSLRVYINSFDSPSVEVNDSTATSTSETIHPTTQESNTSEAEERSTSTSRHYDSESLHIIDDFNSSDKSFITTCSSSAHDQSSTTNEIFETSSASETTSETKTSETIPTSETSSTSRTTTSTKSHEGSPRNDSALSSRSFITTDGKPSTKSPDSEITQNDHKVNDDKTRSVQINNNATDFSDTGISLQDDTNRNSFNSGNSDSKPGSASKTDLQTITFVSESLSGSDSLSKNNLMKLKNTKLECIEVIVSETLNSSQFFGKSKSNEVVNSEVKNICNNISNIKMNETLKNVCTSEDIDQYVSNILLDSLNTMTEQINEINNITDDDVKLNILEKEIKVKLQNLCISPINLPATTIISSFVTNIPDDELLETTIIEDKKRNSAFTAEPNLYSDTIPPGKFPNQSENSSDYSGSNSRIDPFTLRESEFENNNLSDALNVRAVKKNDDLHFYLNDLNENPDISQEESTKKSVLDKLNKMFESTQDVDNNFNICLDSHSKNYFCGSVYRDDNHLEMSTDVDVFVDNSLNKMISSIDLCADVSNLTLENGNEQSEGNLSSNKRTNIKKLEKNLDKHSNHKEVLSNIGSGSLYHKPTQDPLIVPRFSAAPNTESMEVNTSSDDEVSTCESDCLSFIDSLDDPNSPRLVELENRRKLSKHDKTPVRGSVIAMLPENSSINKSPIKSKCEPFFVTIKGEENECLNEIVTVAEHMPVKLKEKLIKRQQKRELRKEHRKKKIKLLNKEFEKVSKVFPNCQESENTRNINQPCIKESLNEEKKKCSSNKTQACMKLNKKDNSKAKIDHERNEFQPFVIDRKGDIKIVDSSKKTPDKEAKRNLKRTKFKIKSDTNDLKSEFNEFKNMTNKNDEIQDDHYDPCLTGPRRLYHKTEFKEGNKHVEILEILECIESSPELEIDNLDHTCENDKSSTKKSKIPVFEKLHKTFKRKNGSNKLLKRCRSPISKHLPFNILAAKSDSNVKTGNSKVDHIIANILIDAIKEDDLTNKKFRVISPVYDKPMHPVIKKLTSSEFSLKKFISQTNSDKNTNLTKYKQHFEVIPEERSSMSIESQGEDKAYKIPLSSGNISDKTCLLETVSNRQEIKERVFKKPSKDIISKKCVDVEIQGNIANRVECHDVSTSPLPQYTSIATSPILVEYQRGSSTKEMTQKQIKGKKALQTKEGWAGFCKPERVCSPEQEGPSSIKPDGEAIGGNRADHQMTTTSLNSQRILRRVDSKNNIKQISINHKVPQNSKKHVSPQTADVLKECNKSKSHATIGDKYKRLYGINDAVTEVAIDDSSDAAKISKKNTSVQSDEENMNRILNNKNKITDLYRGEVKTMNDNKILKLHSPFANESYSRSRDSSSGSDSETVACPTLIPRWLPNSNNFRQRRVINRRNQRRDDYNYKPSSQNNSGGWSVTLAGSCYTVLPSDVEMKVIFPKAKQQTASQSDSGLGEDNSRPRKQNLIECKKCSTNLQSCKCLSAVKKPERDGNANSDREHFLPPTLGRKPSRGSGMGHSGSLDRLSNNSKKFDYLPEVNLTSGNKNKSRKPTMQMDRRYSLHCWLPEDRSRNLRKVTKMQIRQSVEHSDGDELSVFGCAIMPEIKPRVPTMSERDLTRIHATQYYSRTRRY